MFSHLPLWQQKLPWLALAAFSAGLWSGCQRPGPLPRLAPRLGPQMVAAIARLELPSVPPSAIALQVFAPDDRCEALVSTSETIAWAGEQPPPRERLARLAVLRAVTRQSIPKFEVGNYGIALRDRTAVVDIAVAPTSLRQIVSLSRCEQFGLFRSIEATLTRNPRLQVDRVEFTEAGREIYL
ncbi:MAG: hypothetical protein HC918_12220 [Oscillatoriales cyanobacterium SM2_1_8]|nr:hypothetical protein [Oscillatoriales cyanobacterium SM2_1_8]